MADVKKLAEELVNLKVTEVNELATILKEEYGIEPAAAAVAVAAPAAGAGQAAAAATGRYRNLVFVSQLHDACYLFRRFREHDYFRCMEINRVRFFICLEGIQFFRIRRHVVLA